MSFDWKELSRPPISLDSSSLKIIFEGDSVVGLGLGVVVVVVVVLLVVVVVVLRVVGSGTKETFGKEEWPPPEPPIR